MTPNIFNFLCKADLSIPTNLAVLEIFPPNFLIWEIRYSFSKFSLASLKGIDKFSATVKVSIADLDKDSLSKIVEIMSELKTINLINEVLLKVLPLKV